MESIAKIAKYDSAQARLCSVQRTDMFLLTNPDHWLVLTSDILNLIQACSHCCVIKIDKVPFLLFIIACFSKYMV